MKTRGFQRVWALVLTVLMIVSLVPSMAFAAAGENELDYRVVHLDAGRKYFSPENIKKVIDNAAEAHFNQLDLYLLDNQGFRFALNDMTVTTQYGSYDLTKALGDGYSDGSKFPDGTNKYLTQSEMADIIAYAKSKGVAIVPSINMPGHMGAILEEFPQFRYSGSKSSIDLENGEAVAFVHGILEKYTSYFQSQGVKFFNIGADEYANDVGSMGFDGLYQSGKAGKFVDFVNAANAIVKSHGMTMRVYNDGIYYNNDTSMKYDKDIEVCYWTSGWGGYRVASAKTIANQGHKLINTDGGYYWVLGNSGWQCSATKASGFDYKAFQGGTISNPAGAMFCIWCDDARAASQESVISQTASVIAAFGEALPYKAETKPEPTEAPTEAPAEPEETVCDGEYGVCITAPGLTGLTVSDADRELNIPGVANYLLYNITPVAGETEYHGAAAVSIAIPDGWNVNNVRAFVIENDEPVTVEGEVVDGKYVFTAPHFSQMGILELAAATKDVTVNVANGEKSTVYTQVGSVGTEGTYTTADGIASYTITHVPAKNGTTMELGSKINVSQNTTSTGVITDNNGHYLVVSGTTISSTTDITRATKFEITRSGTIYNSTYTIRADNGNYLNITSGTNRTLTVQRTSVNWTYNQTSGFTANSRRLTYNNGWTVTSNTSGNGFLYSVTEGTESTPAQTEITFTGKKVGTTYVTVGDTRYTVNVRAEDLSRVTPLTVEYWITNRQVTAGGATWKQISASDAFDENGVALSDMVPNTGTWGANNCEYWKGTRLASNNKQTNGGGVDKTKAGNDFAYVRYYNGSWAYSADRVSWTNFSTGDQAVAYYLQVTKVTDEVTTIVSDWGEPYPTWNGNQYILVDYAVKYESGDMSPNAFPINSRTQEFHCVHNDPACGQAGNYYYRRIGTVMAEGTSEFEVYMITLTPTSDSPSTYLAATANNNGQNKPNFYAGTEKVIWVDDEANLPEDFKPAGKKYSSITGAYRYTVGGNPEISGFEVYDRHGMLVTYYVRAKVTEDSLTVHYIDQTPNQEFYSYNIAVKSGTVFNTGIRLANPWKGPLMNGSVANFVGATQTVSADLSTMPAIGANYRYSDYTCVKVERSADGKDVYLYYTFNNTHKFVIDFGLPLNITESDLLIHADWTNATITGAQFGIASVDGNGILYKPTKVLNGVETLQLLLTEPATNSKSTQIVYIYPASNILFEAEDFMKQSDRSGAYNAWTVDGSSSSNQQTADQALRYGYDGAYSTNTGYGNGAAWISDMSNASGTEYLTTTISGTGFDLIGQCGQDTGYTCVMVKQNGKLVKAVIVDTYYSVGTINQVPLAHLMLAEGTYDVTVYGGYRAATAAAASTFGAFGGGIDESLYEMFDMLESEGIYMDNIDLVYFDNASPFAQMGGGMATYAMTSEADAAAAPTPTLPGSKIVVDGIRVYHGTNTEAYKDAPGEYGAKYTRMLDAMNDNFVAYVDNASGSWSKGNYESNGGPQNEVYLDSAKTDSAVVLNTRNLTVLQISARAVNGSVTLVAGNQRFELKSNTEMYYIVPTNGDTLTVKAEGGMLALANIKYQGKLNAVTEENIAAAIMMLSAPAEPEMVHHDAKDATCTAGGNIEYWQCSDCGKYYYQNKHVATSEIKGTDVFTNPLGHKLQHHDAKAAICEFDGNIAYDYCDRCELYFTEEHPEGFTYEQMMDDYYAYIGVPAAADLVHHDAKPATTTEGGNIEYWQCSACGKYFSCNSHDSAYQLKGTDLFTNPIPGNGNTNNGNGKPGNNGNGNKKPSQNEVFKPKLFKAAALDVSLIANRVVTLTVKTSLDVDYITVNGKKLQPSNKALVKLGIEDFYVFTLMENVKKGLAAEYEIVAYNSDKLASEPLHVAN